MGNQLGFEAPTPLARAYVDMFAEGIRDINECLAHAVYFSADKEAVTAKYLAEKFPVHLSGVEKALELCHAQIEDRPAVFTSSSLTWADVLAFVSLGWATSLGATTQAAPKVSALLEAVAAVPRIAAYLSAPHPWF
ncbi:MAG: glutathione S-transferase family protein [archaeon]|nr:glutathione S-transferase family protein [archaeon]